jgi:hypothetical protein
LAISAATANAQPASIQSARFAQPTDRYPHNVLGELRGFGALEVTLDTGTILRLTLPDTRVFEDIAPRLWDIDGDGQPEVVAVESDQRLGARLTAWSIDATQTAPTLTLRAASDFIGTRFRWLAPVGIADFTGNGRPEIAYVAMPHLAKRLILVELAGNRFVPVAQMDGVSNHRIGQDFITGGVVFCTDGPRILVPSGDWQRRLQVRYADGALRVVGDVALSGPNAFTPPDGCRDQAPATP